MEGEIDCRKAKKLGAQLEVDYVVFGSLTKLGDSASLDLKVVDDQRGKAAVLGFRAGEEDGRDHQRGR